MTTTVVTKADLVRMDVGKSINVLLNGTMPARLFLVERTFDPTLFMRFRCLVHNCEVAELSAEELQNGEWIFEEL